MRAASALTGSAPRCARAGTSASMTAKSAATTNARNVSAALTACASRSSVGNRSATLSSPSSTCTPTSATPVLTAARTARRCGTRPGQRERAGGADERRAARRCDAATARSARRNRRRRCRRSRECERQASPAPLELTYAPMHIVTNAIAAVTTSAGCQRFGRGGRGSWRAGIRRGRKDRHRRKRRDERHRGAPVKHDGERCVRQANGRRTQQHLGEKDHRDRDDGGSDERRLFALPPRADHERDDERRNEQRQQAMRPFPDRTVGHRREDAARAERPIGTGLAGPVYPGPASQDDRPEGDQSPSPAPDGAEFSCQFQGTGAPSWVTMTLDAGSHYSSPATGARRRAREGEGRETLVGARGAAAPRRAAARSASRRSPRERRPYPAATRSSSSATPSTSQNSAFTRRYTSAASSA